MDTSIPWARPSNTTRLHVDAAASSRYGRHLLQPYRENLYLHERPESGGCNKSLRQGLSADLADGARPNNVLGESNDRAGLQPGLGRSII